jgi:hypothetical protein
MRAVTPTMDEKLAKIRSGQYRSTDFIIADAKDGDMSNGAATAGPDTNAEGAPTGRMKPLAHYRKHMRDVVASGMADIMLMSLSTAEVLSGEGTFEGSPVTPAVRLNDATDIGMREAGATKLGQRCRFELHD